MSFNKSPGGVVGSAFATPRLAVALINNVIDSPWAAGDAIRYDRPPLGSGCATQLSGCSSCTLPSGLFQLVYFEMVKTSSGVAGGAVVAVNFARSEAFGSMPPEASSNAPTI